MPKEHLWWQHGIIYQIYPRSFMDNDGDGVGDLQGIISRIDYLDWLGVDAIWISPIYSSPMADFGYDISDYTGIYPLFGTMEAFDRLLNEVHERDIKLILDLVPNHTSDEHPWFQESRSSLDSPKRDWYLWADPGPEGGPPNNWLSVFGGSAWSWDETTQQYYYHAFLDKQPDLNWRNPEVQEAMFDVMRFWLDKGVDGFRIDVLWHIIKDSELRDNPRNPDYEPGDLPYHSLIPAFTTDQPEVHAMAAKMREVTNEYDERVLIGEIYLPIGELVAYYGRGKGIQLPFNFHLIQRPWETREIAAVIAEYEAALPEGGWPNWVLSNHDKSRIATRAGGEQTRVAAMLLLTLRGTPTMYYGDELGMQNVEIPYDRVQDPKQKNMPEINAGRDPVRTPMQWDDSPSAGFTMGRPWLPLADNYEEVNVEAQRNNPTSILTLYKRLIELRRSEPALATGRYVPFDEREHLLAYIREKEGANSFLIALNFSEKPRPFSLQGLQGRLLLSTHLNREEDSVEGEIRLRGDEGVVIRIED